MDAIVDIKVKESLARLRRGLVSVDWRGNRLAPDMRAHGQSGSVDDRLAYHTEALRAASVAWSPIGEAWSEGSAPRWRPSPEMNAFVQKLSSTVDAEASILVGLAARARDISRDVALAAARKNSEASADATDRHAPGTDDDLFEAIRESLSDVAETTLEAALSAVRAGSCSRSLVTVDAGETEIAAALRAARDEIEIAVAAIEDLGARLAASVLDVRAAARAMDERRAGRAAASASDQLAAIALTGALREDAEAAAKIAAGVADGASDLAGLVDALSGRMLAILRESPAGDRRRSRRIAYNGRCLLATGANGEVPARTLDISLGGALVRAEAGAEFRRGQPLSLVLPGLPAISASVAGVSPQGLHVSFDLGHATNAQARPPLLRMLADLHRRDDAWVEQAIALAGAFAAALAEAANVRTDGDGAPVADAASLIDNAPEASPDMIYAVALDRRRRVVHGAIAQAWRDREDFAAMAAGAVRADAVGLRHAQNRRPYLAQNVQIAGRSVRSVSAPVYLAGAHWGCVEVAFDTPRDDERQSGAEIDASLEKDQG